MNIVSLTGNRFINLDLLVKAYFSPRTVGPKPASTEKLAEICLYFAIPLTKPIKGIDPLNDQLYQTILHGEDAEKIQKLLQQMRIK